MTEFDFSTLKPTVAKANEIPKITRTRIGAPNPLAPHFAKSMAKEDENGYGQWLNITLPVDERTDKAPYGTVAKTAFLKLTAAAKDTGKGLEKLYQDNDDNTVTLFYRSKPRAVKGEKADS